MVDKHTSVFSVVTDLSWLPGNSLLVVYTRSGRPSDTSPLLPMSRRYQFRYLAPEVAGRPPALYHR